MLGEALEYLAIRPEGVYLDVTAGLGSHTRAIAERLTTGFVIACDRDAESLERAILALVRRPSYTPVKPRIIAARSS